LQNGARAKADLAKAKQVGDRQLLALVAQRYFHTAAGAEATDGKSASAPEETVAEEKKSRAAQPGGGPAAAPQSRKKQDRSNS